MKKFVFLILGLFGIGMSFGEEVNIGLVSDGDWQSETTLRVIPGYYFLDNKCVVFDSNVAYNSNDVVVYDYNLNPSAIHFNCENFRQSVHLFDTRYTVDDDEYKPLTQCFFNNDALYEGIANDVKTVNTEWGEEEVRYNYRVINQNGDVLYAFEAPQGYEKSDAPYFYKVSDDVIIVRMTFDKSGNSSCKCYYSLKVGQTGTMVSIRQMCEIKLESNPVRKGDNLVVTVGGDFRESSIIVTSLSGLVVKEVPVIDGKAVIGTTDLPCGLYVVSQKEVGASAKFIVK